MEHREIPDYRLGDKARGRTKIDLTRKGSKTHIGKLHNPINHVMIIIILMSVCVTQEGGRRQ